MSGCFDPVGGIVRQGRFRYLPVVPGKVEFAVVVRNAILSLQPRTIAIELPDALAKHFVRGVRRLPQVSAILYGDIDEEEERLVCVPVEASDPFAEAVRSGIEVSANLVFIEPGLQERPHLDDRYPDPYTMRAISYAKYIALYREHSDPPPSRDVFEHAAGMAWKLQGTDPLAEVLVVCSLNLLKPLLAAMEQPQEEPEPIFEYPDVQLVHPHPDCLAEISVETPYLQNRYEQYRLLMETALLDRPRVQLDLLREAEQAYETNTGSVLVYWQRRTLARFARNLALASEQLLPGLFDLTVAARSVVDDNYAWEVWERANDYPAQKLASDLETVNLSGDQVWLNTKRLRIRRRLPGPKQKGLPRGLKRRQKEHKAGEWAEQLHGDSICSYPPEDLVIEGYARFLKQHARQIISQERERVEPFTTSLLDGVDLRQTVRNWHEQKIYVRELERATGEVGSVVVVFDEDPQDRFTYCTTWLGENQNESDMAFYSTHPFEHLVGPGIGRAEYGGFLMSLPARRMYDVWGDPDYDFAETKPERLLLAALDYSVEKNVVYVGPKPPRSIMRTVAGRLGRQILYIPLGQVSAGKLQKIRVVHVLDSYARRDSAKEFLW